MNEFFVLLLLLLLSGVFSGSETALTSLSLARAEALREEGRQGAQAMWRLKRNPSRMLITILIGNNLVNIGASVIATVIATERLGHLGPSVVVGVLTLLILIFGEITPKSLATRYAERIALLTAPFIYGLMRLLTPLVWLFDWMTRKVQHATSATADPTITEQELITLAEHGEEEGTIEAGEREMIERVFILNDIKAADVMTPLGAVFMLDGRLSLKESLEDLVKQPHTRIPLHGENPTEIIRILHLREFLAGMAHQSQDTPLLELAHDPLFCPENQPIDELLNILRRSKKHMAVVVDEHGATQGVVTLEDLLEELVGEIYDESDVLPNNCVPLDEERVLVAGNTELRVVEKFFAMEIPGKPTDTVSRWVLGHTERIPSVDERFVLDGLEVTIQGASHRRIEQLVLRRVPVENGGEAARD